MLPNVDTKIRPPVYLSESDRSHLAALLNELDAGSFLAEMLDEELDRATVVPDAAPLRFVRIGSLVEIENLQSGRVRTVRLTMDETDVDGGSLSVLSLAGAALIGLKEGAAFTWSTPRGRVQTIRVLKIIDEDDDGPFAA